MGFHLPTPQHSSTSERGESPATVYGEIAAFWTTAGIIDNKVHDDAERPAIINISGRMARRARLGGEGPFWIDFTSNGA